MSRLDEAKTAPLSGSLGTLVSGLDLRKDLDAATAAALRALLLERLVLVFPDQHLSADEQRALMRHFGEVEKHPERPRVLEDSDDLTEGAAVTVWIGDERREGAPVLHLE